jgi:undecaprenyl-phosphate 4-deoxy-4-formamido-L-arabinose transferase
MLSDTLLSVVIPVYRSEAYLAQTVGELVTALAPVGPFEIILVNDGSPDGVQKVIDGLCATDPRIRAVVPGHNLGQHRATLLGFARTRGDVVVTVDDDGQNPPAAAITVARDLIARDLDVSYGRFNVVAQSGLRRVASAANTWLSARTLHNRTGVALSNVRALRGDLARALGAVDSPYPYIDAMIFRMASRIGDVPVEHRARSEGASSYSLTKLVSLWVSHLTSLSVLPLKAAMAGSFVVSFLGFLVGIFYLVRVLIERKAPAGWLSLFCAVTFLFSILFLFLGIVSAYLGRMYVSLNERGLIWVRSEGTGPAARADREDPPRASPRRLAD